MVIEPVGSCCTLVAERILQLNRSLIDRTVADLLLGESPGRPVAPARSGLLCKQVCGFVEYISGRLIVHLR